MTREGGEVDFVVDPPRGDRELIQVCWSIADPGTRDRAPGALPAAMRELRAARATIVTWHEDERLDGGARARADRPPPAPPPAENPRIPARPRVRSGRAGP